MSLEADFKEDDKVGEMDGRTDGRMHHVRV